MSLVISNDHTLLGVGLYGLAAPLTLCWVECDRCKRRVSQVVIGSTDFDTGLARASAALDGCRWATVGRVSRPYCHVCQRTQAPGRFGWSDGWGRFGLKPATPSRAQLRRETRQKCRT